MLPPAGVRLIIAESHQIFQPQAVIQRNRLLGLTSGYYSPITTTMQLSSFTLLAILASAANALADNVPASPATALTHTVNLFNGVNNTVATVGRPAIPMLAGGRKNMCAGSSRCTNKQGFRDECRAAYIKIDPDVVYTTDGTYVDIL
ncbi:hypothetical protein V496_09206 [Pseudogymnoascus sp. VKM F-4515 (FW-2607)]|nr:hypothetical protein V496_09206 [Pseudogymnoascus sp. VKM F-4515 (FW-2607)]KFY68187.1 hypothetical protein V498_10722 [Pseudogymnoascus sp. VKM F-4517 (FW-2822)]